MVTRFQDDVPAILLEREIQEIDPDKHNHDANNFIENFAAHPRLVLDPFAHCPTQRADDDKRDGEPDRVNQHREKALERSLVEGNIGQDDKQHRGPSPNGDCTKREPEQECTGYGIGHGYFEEIEDTSYRWLVYVEKLQPHQDQKNPSDGPRDCAVEEQQVFSDKSCNQPERQEHKYGPDAERYGQFKDIGKRELGISARQVSYQSEAQDAVARTDTGNQPEDEDTGD